MCSFGKLGKVLNVAFASLWWDIFVKLYEADQGYNCFFGPIINAKDIRMQNFILFRNADLISREFVSAYMHLACSVLFNCCSG